jgi:hypothetical protein
MRAYVAVRATQQPTPPPAQGYNRTWTGVNPPAATPALGYSRANHAYVAVAASRQAVATGRGGQQAILAGGFGILGVGVVALILALTLAGGPAVGGRYSAYRPAGIFAVLGAITGNPMAQAAPAAAPGTTGPAPSGDRVAVAAPTADHALMAPPSVSAALIDQVLAQYSSPAAGQGAVFYDLGVQYGIDPAYALAFFIHESSAGTKGVARFTNSIGNIRTTAGYRDYEGYRAYDTWAAGIEDWYKLIKDLYIEGWGKRTVAAIIPTYAPSADRNDPPSYIANVTGLVDSWQQK